MLGDSLYANATFFEMCKKYKWEYLIRYKDGSIPTLAEKYNAISQIREADEFVVNIETIYKRKPSINAKHKMRWVNHLDYKGFIVTVMELEIEHDGKKYNTFQWISSMIITGQKAFEFAETGRKRWKIENEGFNIQKNYRYFITHANSLNYQAMKNHYLITQLADMLLQLYENGVKGLKLIRRTIEKISEGILMSLKNQAISDDELCFKRMQLRMGVS
jgi:hypothetical protein